MRVVVPRLMHLKRPLCLHTGTETVGSSEIDVGEAHTHTCMHPRRQQQLMDSLLLHFPRVPVPVRTRPKPVAVAQQLAG